VNAGAESANPPQDVSIVIVGAGLSGLVAARELEACGRSDVVVLVAQDRVGGRIKQFVPPNGRVLMEGAEFTGPVQVELQKLAASLGIDVERMPIGGKFVRYHDGERHVEDSVLESDPVGAAAFRQQRKRSTPWSPTSRPMRPGQRLAPALGTA
jgi:monoamine oxidase